jgi:hypothetical protein
VWLISSKLNVVALTHSHRVREWYNGRRGDVTLDTHTATARHIKHTQSSHVHARMGSVCCTVLVRYTSTTSTNAKCTCSWSSRHTVYCTVFECIIKLSSSIRSSAVEEQYYMTSIILCRVGYSSVRWNWMDSSLLP